MVGKKRGAKGNQRGAARSSSEVASSHRGAARRLSFRNENGTARRSSERASSNGRLSARPRRSRRLQELANQNGTARRSSGGASSNRRSSARPRRSRRLLATPNENRTPRPSSGRQPGNRQRNNGTVARLRQVGNDIARRQSARSNRGNRLQQVANTTNVNTAGPSSLSTGSPLPHCSFCLDSFTNRSFTDPCMHEFCFNCIRQWSEIKPKCPLCNQIFPYILHNVRTNDEYDVYHVPIAPNMLEHEDSFDDEMELSSPEFSSNSSELDFSNSSNENWLNFAAEEIEELEEDPLNIDGPSTSTGRRTATTRRISVPDGSSSEQPIGKRRKTE